MSAVKKAVKLSNIFAEKPHPNFKCNQCEYVHTNKKGLAMHIRMKQEFLKLVGTMTVRKKVYTAVEFMSVNEGRTDLVWLSPKTTATHFLDCFSNI